MKINVQYPEIQISKFAQSNFYRFTARRKQKKEKRKKNWKLKQQQKLKKLEILGDLHVCVCVCVCVCSLEFIVTLCADKRQIPVYDFSMDNKQSYLIPPLPKHKKSKIFFFKYQKRNIPGNTVHDKHKWKEKRILRHNYYKAKCAVWKYLTRQTNTNHDKIHFINDLWQMEL